ncbi:MAG: hypoxanthine phosphoribosyltransferase [Bdellovibrionales bacterium]|nr:hypoxanthine phosphoribosyltransferase [Bdellovibrionales bacterium]
MDLNHNITTLLTQKDIELRVQELGAQITKEFAGKELICVCILKGSVIFFSDLIRHIHLPIKIDFLRVSSYGNNLESSGEVRLLQDVSLPVEGKHILIVEDIVDTGHTLAFLRNYLQSKNPLGVSLVSLLHKPSQTQTEVNIDYLGFTIENHFVVGYGLDAAEEYRNLPYVGIVGTDS